jgi:hypothetical protein
MLLRISLIVAILAGLAAGGLGYYEVSTQIPALKDQRDKEHDAKVSEIAAHTKTKAELKKTQGELAQTKTELADTKSQLDKAVARADAQEKRANDLSDKLAKAISDRDDAQNALAAYKASGLKPEEVIRLNNTLKDALAHIEALKGEYAVLNRQYLAKSARLERYEGTNENFVKLPANLKGKVIVVDPKWDFVVLNIGEEKGAIEDGEMLVSRDGHLVAKVIIRSVQKDRCIANVIPGWKLGDLYEGDDVIPAHPASS